VPILFWCLGVLWQQLQQQLASNTAGQVVCPVAAGGLVLHTLLLVACSAREHYVFA
jgi:hypothetical protein